MTTTSPPEQRRVSAPEPPSRPCLVDYLALLAGAALGIHLMRLAPIDASPAHSLAPQLAQVFAFLPVLMRVGEGIVLLWPIFFITKALSRTEGLTAGEWLWLLSFVGVLLLTALTAWEHLLGLPPAFQVHAAKPRVLWYMIFAPAFASLALLVLILDLFRAPPPPWTHSLALALALWPAPPALVVVLAGKFSTP